MTSAATETSALSIFGRVAPRPSAELDRVLDATERCLARYGIRRTSMTDIAKEMGVSRPTLYRQIPSLEEAVALVAARLFYRFVDDVTALMAAGGGPDGFIEATVRALSTAVELPVVSRVLHNEPELMGELITGGHLRRYADQVVDLLAPLLDAAMANGSIRSGDPRLAAGVMVRLAGALLLFPLDDMEPIARYALEPVLTPAPAAGKARSRR